jgi:hypothetical protein
MLINCPSCGSLATVPIVYGKPGNELIEAEKFGLVVLGSCVVDEIDRTCRRCHWKWATGQKSAAYRDDRPAVESILKDLEYELIEIRKSIERDFMRFGRYGVDRSGKWIVTMYDIMRRQDSIWKSAVDRLLQFGTHVVIYDPGGKGIQARYSVHEAHIYLHKISWEWFDNLNSLSESCLRLGRAGRTGNVDELKLASVDVQHARESLNEFMQRLRGDALYRNG